MRFTVKETLVNKSLEEIHDMLSKLMKSMLGA